MKTTLAIIALITCTACTSWVQYPVGRSNLDAPERSTIRDRLAQPRGHAVRNPQGDVEVRDNRHRLEATIRDRPDGTSVVQDRLRRTQATIGRPDRTGQRRVVDHRGRTLGFVRERRGRTEVLDAQRRPVASTGVLLEGSVGRSE